MPSNDRERSPASSGHSPSVPGTETLNVRPGVLNSSLLSVTSMYHLEPLSGMTTGNSSLSGGSDTAAHPHDLAAAAISSTALPPRAERATPVLAPLMSSGSGSTTGNIDTALRSPPLRRTTLAERRRNERSAGAATGPAPLSIFPATSAPTSVVSSSAAASSGDYSTIVSITNGSSGSGATGRPRFAVAAPPPKLTQLASMSSSAPARDAMEQSATPERADLASTTPALRASLEAGSSPSTTQAAAAAATAAVMMTEDEVDAGDVDSRGSTPTWGTSGRLRGPHPVSLAPILAVTYDDDDEGGEHRSCSLPSNISHAAELHPITTTASAPASFYRPRSPRSARLGRTGKQLSSTLLVPTAVELIHASHPHSASVTATAHSGSGSVGQGRRPHHWRTASENPLMSSDSEGSSRAHSFDASLTGSQSGSSSCATAASEQLRNTVPPQSSTSTPAVPPEPAASDDVNSLLLPVDTAQPRVLTSPVTGDGFCVASLAAPEFAVAGSAGEAVPVSMVSPPPPSALLLLSASGVLAAHTSPQSHGSLPLLSPPSESFGILCPSKLRKSEDSLLTLTSTVSGATPKVRFLESTTGTTTAPAAKGNSPGGNTASTTQEPAGETKRSDNDKDPLAEVSPTCGAGQPCSSDATRNEPKKTNISSPSPESASFVDEGECDDSTDTVSSGSATDLGMDTLFFRIMEARRREQARKDESLSASTAVESAVVAGPPLSATRALPSPLPRAPSNRIVGKSSSTHAVTKGTPVRSPSPRQQHQQHQQQKQKRSHNGPPTPPPPFSTASRDVARSAVGISPSPHRLPAPAALRSPNPTPRRMHVVRAPVVQGRVDVPQLPRESGAQPTVSTSHVAEGTAGQPNSEAAPLGSGRDAAGSRSHVRHAFSTRSGGSFGSTGVNVVSISSGGFSNSASRSEGRVSPRLPHHGFRLRGTPNLTANSPATTTAASGLLSDNGQEKFSALRLLPSPADPPIQRDGGQSPSPTHTSTYDDQRKATEQQRWGLQSLPDGGLRRGGRWRTAGTAQAEPPSCSLLSSSSSDEASSESSRSSSESSTQSDTFCQLRTRSHAQVEQRQDGVTGALWSSTLIEVEELPSGVQRVAPMLDGVTSTSDTYTHTVQHADDQQQPQQRREPAGRSRDLPGYLKAPSSVMLQVGADGVTRSRSPLEAEDEEGEGKEKEDGGRGAEGALPDAARESPPWPQTALALAGATALPQPRESTGGRSDVRADGAVGGCVDAVKVTAASAATPTSITSLPLDDATSTNHIIGDSHMTLPDAVPSSSPLDDASPLGRGRDEEEPHCAASTGTILPLPLPVSRAPPLLVAQGRRDGRTWTSVLQPPPPPPQPQTLASPTMCVTTPASAPSLIDAFRVHVVDVRALSSAPTSAIAVKSSPLTATTPPQPSLCFSSAAAAAKTDAALAAVPTVAVGVRSPPVRSPVVVSTRTANPLGVSPDDDSDSDSNNGDVPSASVTFETVSSTTVETYSDASSQRSCSDHGSARVRVAAAGSGRQEEFHSASLELSGGAVSESSTSGPLGSDSGDEESPGDGAGKDTLSTFTTTAGTARGAAAPWVDDAGDENFEKRVSDAALTSSRSMGDVVDVSSRLDLLDSRTFSVSGFEVVPTATTPAVVNAFPQLDGPLSVDTAAAQTSSPLPLPLSSAQTFVAPGKDGRLRQPRRVASPAAPSPPPSAAAVAPVSAIPNVVGGSRNIFERARLNTSAAITSTLTRARFSNTALSSLSAAVSDSQLPPPPPPPPPLPQARKPCPANLPEGEEDVEKKVSPTAPVNTTFEDKAC